LPEHPSDSDSPGSHLPPPEADGENDDADEAEPEFPGIEEDGDIDLPQFPTTHEVILKDHTKVVSALTLDPSGARVLSGSHDYDVKLWDFGGMDMRCKPFKSWEPAGTYYVRLCSFIYNVNLTFLPQIHDLRYSNDGQKFLVVSGTTQAKLYDRDGEEQYVFAIFCESWIASPDLQGDLYQG
jgi:WD40 repeat protein